MAAVATEVQNSIWNLLAYLSHRIKALSVGKIKKGSQLYRFEKWRKPTSAGRRKNKPKQNHLPFRGGGCILNLETEEAREGELSNPNTWGCSVPLTVWLNENNREYSTHTTTQGLPCRRKTECVEGNPLWCSVQRNDLSWQWGKDRGKTKNTSDNLEQY